MSGELSDVSCELSDVKNPLGGLSDTYSNNASSYRNM